VRRGIVTVPSIVSHFVVIKPSSCVILSPLNWTACLRAELQEKEEKNKKRSGFMIRTLIPAGTISATT
jgi:hypothetical protein